MEDTSSHPMVLISRLALDDIRWRTDAEDRLVQLGEPAIEPLIGALKNVNPTVRYHAVRALTRFAERGHHARLLPHLVERLADTDNNSAVAIVAEKVLVHLGKTAVPALLGASTDPARSQAVRARAVRALGKISRGVPIESVRPLLKDLDPAVRAQAATTVGTLAADGDAALHGPARQELQGMLASAQQLVFSLEAALDQARRHEEEIRARLDQ